MWRFMLVAVKQQKWYVIDCKENVNHNGIAIYGQQVIERLLSLAKTFVFNHN